MTETTFSKQDSKQTTAATAQMVYVEPSPHFFNPRHTTRRMMGDVLLALIPVVGMAVYLFKWRVAFQLGICLAGCLITELVLTRMRGKPISLADGSAAITGLILGLSLPAPAPWYVGVIASVVAIGIGKVIFGGLGMNIFNPAMVGRAFVMISFAGVMAASGYVDSSSSVDAITMATPLNLYKQSHITTPIWNLFLGTVNGSPGEVSALACLIGGLYLCIRRTASWEIPAGIFISVILMGGLETVLHPDSGWTVLHHLTGGALLFGAFFIATDPVTSPLTPRGKLVFGMGVGFLIMLLRLFSGYPEGVMFAVLFMNALTPLINRWLKHWTMGETKEHRM